MAKLTRSCENSFRVESGVEYREDFEIFKQRKTKLPSDLKYKNNMFLSFVQKSAVTYIKKIKFTVQSTYFYIIASVSQEQYPMGFV